MIRALVNGRILQESGLSSGLAVLTEDERITAIVAADDPRLAHAQRIDLQGHLLLPGFIDVQVNGGGGVLFNDDPSVAAIRTIGAAHRRFGTTGFLPTLISDELPVIERALAAVRAAIEAGVPGVLGIHIEGPFLNARRKGVHDAARLRVLDETAIDLLTSLGCGRTVVTLAPEMTTPQIIRRLSDAGVIVCAGHTDATCAEAQTALAHGLRGFTHLYNAMSPLTARAPGVVGAALDDRDSWCGLIVDGAHVDPVALRIAVRSKPRGRMMLVTDAMPSVGTGEDEFMLMGRRIEVHGHTCRDAAGTLAGSALGMADAVGNAVRLLDIDIGEAARMASEYPAAFLGLEAEIGRIEPGHRANLVLADAGFRVIETWIDGHSSQNALES